MQVYENYIFTMKRSNISLAVDRQINSSVYDKNWISLAMRFLDSLW